MKKLILFLIFIFSAIYLHAQDIEISQIAINQKNQNVEIMLYFNAPLPNDIVPKKLQSQNYQGIFLPDIKVSKFTNENLEHPRIKSIQLINVKGGVNVLAFGSDFSINLSKSNAILRLDILPLNAISTSTSNLDKMLDTPLEVPLSSTATQTPAAQTPATQTPTMQDVPMQASTEQEQDSSISQIIPIEQIGKIDTWRYLAVIGVLGFLVILLFVIKQRIKSKPTTPTDTKDFRALLNANIVKSANNINIPQDNKVLPPNPNVIHNTLRANIFKNILGDAALLSQQELDTQNRILNLESNGYIYSILVTNGNPILLDRFSQNEIFNKEQIHPSSQSNKPKLQIHTQNTPISQEDTFASMLEKKKARIENLKKDINA